MNLDSEKEQILDNFELNLQKWLNQLKDCQNQKNFDSCLKCPEVLECDIRDSYVVAVYESMNHGESGGFEF
jgi:hypothetical protein